MKDHPRIWWDGSSFLYLLPDEELELHRERVPYFYRARTIEDVTLSDGPVVELVKATASTTDAHERLQMIMLIIAAFRSAVQERVYASVQQGMMQATKALRALGVTDKELDAAYESLGTVMNVNPRPKLGNIDERLKPGQNPTMDFIFGLAPGPKEEIDN